MTFVYLTIVNGRVERHEQDHKLTLDEMQGVVGGYIELFDRHDGAGQAHTIDCYCNENGKLTGLAPNVYWPAGQDVIVGPVLIVGGDDATGDVRSLTEAEVARVGVIGPHGVTNFWPVLDIAPVQGGK